MKEIKIKELKPIMNITVYSDGKVELIVKGQHRSAISIDFHAEVGSIPLLSTDENIYDLIQTDNKTEE